MTAARRLPPVGPRPPRLAAGLSAAGLMLLVALAGCSFFEDAATSVAFQIERNTILLGRRDGSVRVVVHDARKRAGPEVREVAAQFDPVGLLVVWYYDQDGKAVASSSTSVIGKWVDIPERIIVRKPIGSPLRIELRRENSRIVIRRVD
jgi:hypothetical protein